MENVLARYNPWWEGEQDYLKDIFGRPYFEMQLRQTIENRSVVFLTGLRRVGKTSLLKLTIKWLIDNRGVSGKNILYISVDDYLLKDSSLLEIVEAFRKSNRLKFSEKIYLFFDEITYKSDYDIQLKNLYDNQNVKIFASSSSASLLNQKRAYLTGRHVTFEISPLNFNEYLNFKKIVLSKADMHLQEAYFLDYLKTGGMPEYVLTGNIEYLKNLIDDVIMKDIAAANNIRNVAVLKDYFLLLMERAGKQASINKIASILHISPDTSRRYFEYFTDTFLIYNLPRWGTTNEKLLAPKKIYACDIGIRIFYTGFRDIGSLFENYVYIRIRDKKPLYVYKDKTEIDFFTSDGVLIEAKFHDENLSNNQQKLFDNFVAKQKYIVRTPDDVENLVRLV